MWDRDLVPRINIVVFGLVATLLMVPVRQSACSQCPPATYPYHTLLEKKLVGKFRTGQGSLFNAYCIGDGALGDYGIRFLQVGQWRHSTYLYLKRRTTTSNTLWAPESDARLIG
jgi:hypothetical protein